MTEAKVKSVIVSTGATIGKGNHKLRPIRKITEVLDLNGEFIAKNDWCSFPIETIHKFINDKFKGEQREQVMEWAYEYFIK